MVTETMAELLTAQGRIPESSLKMVSMTEPEFELFYRRHSRALWSYVCRTTGDAALADDILQKAFFQFLRASHDTDDDIRLKAFLFRIASNLVVDHWRERKREARYLEQNPPDEEVRHEPGLSWDMQRAFRQLKPKERALLWLAHVEEMQHREIAETLDLKERSVKVLLFRARKKLASLMRDHGLHTEVR